MFLPVDPTVAMLGLFVYVFVCVIRGVFSSLNNPKVSHEEFMKMYHQMIMFLEFLLYQFLLLMLEKIL